MVREVPYGRVYGGRTNRGITGGLNSIPTIGSNKEEQERRAPGRPGEGERSLSGSVKAGLGARNLSTADFGRGFDQVARGNDVAQLLERLDELEEELAALREQADFERDEYLPVLTSGGSNPVINGGSFIEGRYERRGQEVTARISLFIDEAVDFGGSSYRFTYPPLYPPDTTWHPLGVLADTPEIFGYGFARSQATADLRDPIIVLPGNTNPPAVILYKPGSATSVGAADFSSSSSLMLMFSWHYITHIDNL